MVNKEGKRKKTDNLYQSSDFNSEACKPQPSHLPWDHLHLINQNQAGARLAPLGILCGSPSY